MSKPDTVQLGPGYTHAARLGQRTIFYGEKAAPKVLDTDGTIRLLRETDWLAMKAAEDKRRARAARNLRPA